MSFFKEVENVSAAMAASSNGSAGVPALASYVPNSIIYVLLYLLALPPNIVLAYMGLRPDLIKSRVKIPTLGMTLANLFGLVGFTTVNIIHLFAALNDVRLSLFTCSFVRTVLYNSSYVCYFLFPVLAIDQYLYVCQNYELKLRSLRVIITVCFAIPMFVAIYDLFLQDVVLYDFMFLYIRMSPYTNVFFFFVLAPSFFVFSFICNLLVLSSIVHRQSKTARKQIGRSLNPRQLQHHKSIIYTYIIQAFLPLVLATPYYIANLCFMFNVEIDLRWFVVGDAIVAMHPLTNALISLFFLRPYRCALRRICPALPSWLLWRDAGGVGGQRCYNSIVEPKARDLDGNGSAGGAASSTSSAGNCSSSCGADITLEAMNAVAVTVNDVMPSQELCTNMVNGYGTHQIQDFSHQSIGLRHSSSYGSINKNKRSYNYGSKKKSRDNGYGSHQSDRTYSYCCRMNQTTKFTVPLAAITVHYQNVEDDMEDVDDDDENYNRTNYDSKPTTISKNLLVDSEMAVVSL